MLLPLTSRISEFRPVALCHAPTGRLPILIGKPKFRTFADLARLPIRTFADLEISKRNLTQNFK